MGFNEAQTITGYVFCQTNGSERMPAGCFIQFLFHCFRIKTRQLIQIFQELRPVLNLFRNNIKIIGWPVVHKHLSLPVKDHAPERWDILETDAIVFRLGPVSRAVYNLQEPESQDKNPEHNQDEQRGILELFVEDTD